MTKDDLRVVFDTSTLISAAILSPSIPRTALDLAFATCTLYASEETLLELKDVLSRNRFKRYRNVEARTEFFTLYSELAEVVSVIEQVTDCRDEKDNQFLSLALAAQAQFIISSDADLLVLNPYRGISIIQPKAFIELIEQLKLPVQ